MKLILLTISLAVAAAVPVAASTAAAQVAPAARPLPVATAQPEAVHRALALAAGRESEAIAAWQQLCEIPALPGRERARAEAHARLLTRAGLPSRILADGNVEARWAGSGTGAPAVICAHLDALHAPGPGAPIRRGEGVMTGPGVLDDGSGLAALLAAVHALHAAGWQPRREVRIVGTVSEEVGLKGSTSYVKANPRLAAFVSVDGILGKIDHGATGIRWTRWTFRGPGGHTLLTSQLASPTLAAGRAIAGLADLLESSDVLLNVSGMTAPGAPNEVPLEASFTVDLRSDDPVELDRLIAQAEKIAREAALREGAGVSAEILQDLPAVSRPGSERSPLVQGAVAVLRHLGVAPVVAARGSSDHNIALIAGIPAIAVGATTGRNAHAPVETAELAPLLAGTQQLILLIVLLGEGLPEATSAQ